MYAEYQKQNKLKQRRQQDRREQNDRKIQTRNKQIKKHRKKSRSQSSSSQNSFKNDKKQKKKQRKQKQHSRSRSRQKDQKQKQQQNTKSRSQITKQKPRINANFLSSLILNQKMTNRRLDEQDINKTSEKLQKNFNEQRRPVTMSQFLSNQSLRIKPQEDNKIYLCQLQRCKKQFDSLQQFQNHIRKHKQQI